MIYNPYKDLFYAVQEADKHLRENNGKPVLPEFLEIWADLVEKFEIAEAHHTVEELADVVGMK